MTTVKSDEQAAILRIRECKDAKALRRYLANARGKSRPVEMAALRQLAWVSAKHDEGTVQHACWVSVHAVEELRKLAGRKVYRMNRMRPKIEKDGEVEALAYCILKETEGFPEILDYGMPELTAEAIAWQYPAYFDSSLLQIAKERLAQHGIDVEQLVSGSAN